MNAFSAPQSAPSIDVDFRDAVPNLLVRGGGFLFGGTGFFVAGSGLQLLVFASWHWMVLGAAATLLTLGTTSVLVSAFIIKGRSWAAMLGVALAVVSAFVTLAWSAYMVVSLAFSPLTFLAAILASVSALVLPFTVPGSVKATRARNALYA